MTLFAMFFMTSTTTNSDKTSHGITIPYLILRGLRQYTQTDGDLVWPPHMECVTRKHPGYEKVLHPSYVDFYLTRVSEPGGTRLVRA